MNILALDLETPKFDKKEVWKGNVYGDPRPPVCWSESDNFFGYEVCSAHQWFDGATKIVQQAVDEANLVVGFNFKHDVAYLRREGVDFSNVKVWDCQIAEFILSKQLSKFPSLNETALRLGLEPKIDVVKTEYWEQGIDTCDIPWPVLSEYAAYDAALTLAVYHKQLKEMTPAQRVLCSLQSQDMLILQEMESTGIVFDEQLCKEKSNEIEHEIAGIKSELASIYPHIPINFASGDQLSAFLYGGPIYYDIQEHVGFYKTGQKAGQPKYKNVVGEHVLPQLFKPLENTLVAKSKSNPDSPQYYETNEGVLKKLVGKNKPILEKLLHLAKLEKLNGTYYIGLPKLNVEMHWPQGKLHGQFNQTLASTGRLSSSKPNQQNFATELQNIFVSQFE